MNNGKPSYIDKEDIIPYIITIGLPIIGGDTNYDSGLDELFASLIK